ncbi:hypothetical protein ACFQ07_29415, partial [Actinomadura adrarensis]
RRAAGPGCRIVEVTGEPTSAVSEDCGSQGAWLRVLRPQDGSMETQARLPVDGQLEEVHTLSVRPLVVRVKDKGLRGTDAVLSYDEQGEVRATIPVSQPAFTLQADASPAANALVHEGLLIVPAERPGDSKPAGEGNLKVTGRLAAYSLAGGNLKWTTEFPGSVRGIAAESRSVTVVTSNDKFVTLAAQTGETTAQESTPDHRSIRGPKHLWLRDGRHVMVDVTGSEDRPASVYARAANAR